MAYENVRSTGIVTVEENNEWRFGNHTDDGTVSVTLDLSTFNVKDETKRDKYLTGLGDKATTIWIKSGIPLAKITASGAYGPYDPNATDGRQNKIAGLLESMVEISVTFGRLGCGQRRERRHALPWRHHQEQAAGRSRRRRGVGRQFLRHRGRYRHPAVQCFGHLRPVNPRPRSPQRTSPTLSAVGRSILTASDAAAARTAIGAGISSFDGSYNSPEGQADDSPPPIRCQPPRRTRSAVSSR